MIGIAIPLRGTYVAPTYGRHCHTTSWHLRNADLWSALPGRAWRYGAPVGTQIDLFLKNEKKIAAAADVVGDLLGQSKKATSGKKK